MSLKPGLKHGGSGFFFCAIMWATSLWEKTGDGISGSPRSFTRFLSGCRIVEIDCTHDRVSESGDLTVSPFPL
jgi:hypothetical protein